MRPTRVTLIPVLVIALATGCRRPPDTAPAPGADMVLEPNAIVTHVVDGDTIDVAIAGTTERVRLLGIDTPEIAHEAFDGRPANAADCYGPEATALTAALLPIGTPVRLERDVVGRDGYGRLLAYVHRASDGLLVNLELVRRGAARPLTIEPNVTYHEQTVAAARRAEHDDVGLWSDCH